MKAFGGMETWRMEALGGMEDTLKNGATQKPRILKIWAIILLHFHRYVEN